MQVTLRTKLAVGLVAVGLAAPATASAEVIEVGKTLTAATPSCPTSGLATVSDPLRRCLALSRTTGYQTQVSGVKALTRIPANGRIVAWTVSLGKPAKKTISSFNSKLGGISQAQISILRTGERFKARTVAVGEIQRLEPFFGTTVQFPLAQSLPVKKNYVIALRVPTWIPAMANAGATSSWRASRPKGSCQDTATQTAQSTGQLAQYWCFYRTAQLTYSATLVTDPVAPAKPKPKKS
jgi:hypothetical protein